MIFHKVSSFIIVDDPKTTTNCNLIKYELNNTYFFLTSFRISLLLTIINFTLQTPALCYLTTNIVLRKYTPKLMPFNKLQICEIHYQNYKFLKKYKFCPTMILML